MISSILTYLGHIGSGISRAAWPLGLLLVLAQWYVSTQINILESMTDVLGQFLAVVVGVNYPNVVAITKSTFSLANYLLPLEEAFTFLGGLVAVRIATAAIRIVKAFVPTIA